LIQNTAKVAIFRNILINFYLNAVYFCDGKASYSSLQCHMILQKSYYTDLLLETFNIINVENIF